MSTLTLAAQGLKALADPDPLPPAPFFERYFLQDGTAAALVLAGIGLGAWWWLARIGKPKEGWIALLCGLLLGAGVFVLARLVTTQREALVQRATQLAEDTIAARHDAVAPLLRSDLTLALLTRQTRHDRAKLLELIRDDVARSRGWMREAGVRWCTATLDSPTTARTQCRVQVETPVGWLPTVWLIHWTRETPDSPWMVRSIDGQQIGLMGPGSVSDP